MNIITSRDFRQSAKKLHRKQKEALDAAVQEILNDVTKGKLKVGDLSGIRTHKFKMVGQLTLIAYTYEDEVLTLTLLAFGSHENFYRDLKR